MLKGIFKINIKKLSPASDNLLKSASLGLGGFSLGVVMG